MARRGRFGRSGAGQQNLSSFISGLATQNRNLEQSSLFKAYYDGSVYGGSVPSFGDLQDFVDGRLGEENIGEAELAYYDNLLKNAKDFAIDKEFKSLNSSFENTEGANFGEFVDFLKGDGADKYGSNLTQVLKNYITYSGNSLSKGQMTEEQYNAASQQALAAVVDDQATYEDVKFESLTTLYNWQKEGMDNMIDRADGKKLPKVITANKNLSEWYKGWISRLESEGLTGSVFYDNLKTNLVNTNQAIRGNEKELASQQAAAFLAARKGAYDQANATLNAFAKTIGSSLGVDTSAATFSFSDLQKESPAALTAWLETQPVETRAAVEAALNNAAGASRGYIDALNSQGKGNTPEALVAAANITMTRKVSGENTSYDEYVSASAVKAQLMKAAGGVPGNEKLVFQNWVKFLKGETTTMFGTGLERITNKYLQDIQTKIDNEVGLYEAALDGRPLTQIPATLVDDVIPSLMLSGFLPNDMTVPGSGDNKFTVAEFGNVLTTEDRDRQMREGTMQIVYSADPNLEPQFLPLSAPAPGSGVVTRLQIDAAGNNYAAQYNGVPIYGSNAGQADKTNGLWGYRIETAGGFIYTDASGMIYKNPPIDTDKLILAADGSGLISRDSTKVGTGPNATRFTVKNGYESEEAGIDDLVDPAALRKAQTATVNPYARVNEDSPVLTNLQATSAIVQAIVDSVSPSSRIAQEGVASLDTTIKAQTQLANMASISQDSGVRVAMMNAQTAAAKAQAKKEEIAQLATIKPLPPRPNYARAYQTGVPTTDRGSTPGAISYGGIPQTTIQQGTGSPQGLGTNFDLDFIFRGLATLANPAAAIGSFIGGTVVPAVVRGLTTPAQVTPSRTDELLNTIRETGGSSIPSVTPASSSGSAGAGVAAAQAAQNTFRAGERESLNIQTVKPAQRIINSGPRAGQPAGGGL
jgi:hypothetical protein